MTTAPGEDAIDGVKVDRLGNSTSQGRGGLWIISPSGQHLGTHSNLRSTSTISPGCADGGTLYMTAEMVGALPDAPERPRDTGHDDRHQSVGGPGSPIGETSGGRVIYHIRQPAFQTETIVSWCSSSSSRASSFRPSSSSSPALDALHLFDTRHRARGLIGVGGGARGCRAHPLPADGGCHGARCCRALSGAPPSHGEARARSSGDGGLLFLLAVIVFVLSLAIVYLRRAELPVVGERLFRTAA